MALDSAGRMGDPALEFMNDRGAIQIAGRVGAFVGRHSVACIVMISVLCAIWTISYFALLLYAMCIGGGIGSPLAYPIGLVACILAATVASLVLFLPSTALAEWVVRRQAWPILVQIPVSVVMLAFLSIGVSAVGVMTSDHASLRSVATASVTLFLMHVVPLGLYWWTAQSGPLLLSIGRAVLAIARSYWSADRLPD